MVARRRELLALERMSRLSSTRCLPWLAAIAVIGALVASAGCGRGQMRGPAWPEPSTTAEDGGESIEPHPSVTYASAIERSAEPEPVEDKSSAAASEPAADAADDDDKDDPASSAPGDEDAVMTDEIIIEIED